MIILEILRNIFLAPLELIFEVIFSIAFKITQSEGLSIIILSLAVSTLVLPLYRRAEKIEAEQRAKEKELSHWVDHIKRNFKGDERYMLLDAYYRENNYNPIYQLKSSISILLQIPFFMAAFDLLGVRAVDSLYGASFLCFENLGSPDRLLVFGDVTINVLPFLMTLVNILTCIIYNRGVPFKTAVRSYILALAFLVLLYYSPSALLLYWTMNNVYSLIKTLILQSAGDRKKGTDTKKSAKTQAAPASGLPKWIASYSDRGTGTAVFLFSGIFMAVLTGLLIPLAFLSASPEEFISIVTLKNPLHYLISSFFVAAGFFVLWPGVFYYLANKKVRTVISVLMFSISVISTVNYLFFGTTGTITTSLVFVKAPSYQLTQILINLAAVVLILLACIFLHRFKKVLSIVYIAAIMAILTISVININKIQNVYSSVTDNVAAFQQEEGPKIQLTADGKNVMIIMIDKGISGFVPYIFNEYPEIAQQFDGFVYYPNTASFGQNTLKTSSALYGGYEYTPDRMDARDTSLSADHDEALRVLPVLFSEQGGSVTLMDLPFAGWSWNSDYSVFSDIDNCSCYHVKDYFNSETESNVNNETRRNRNLFMYSIFKCSPLFMQEFIYDNGDYLSVLVDSYNKYDLMENYRVLENLEGMTQINNDYPVTLLMFDNETAHDFTNIAGGDPYSPYEFEEGYYISDGTKEIYIWDPVQAASYECLVAAMRGLGEYMDYLREIGVYDNTRIIIVSDHGNAMYLFDGLVSDDYGFTAEWYNAMLLVKDFDATGYSTDYTFMTNADVPVIALEGIVDDPVNPATGVPINSDMKNGKIYVSYASDYDENLWNPESNPGSSFYYGPDNKWYELTGPDIFDLDNWVQIDSPE